MNTPFSRREFLRTTGVAMTVVAAAPAIFAAESTAPTKRAHKKGIMWGTIGLKGSVLERMRAVKAAGFDGVEMTSHLDQAEVLAARDQTGLEINSVCGAHHWAKPLSHPDATIRAEGLAALQQTLRDAKAYGANSILLVPGVVNNEVTIEVCWQRSIEQIRRAIPLAEELGVKISIENVWNNFITTEDVAVRYLDEINSPWVQWHFDVGNIIRYGDPIAWIKALRKRITRVHVKEYSRDRAMRTGDVWQGFRVPLLEGANNWAGIMKALDEIGYREYLITEQPGGDTPEGLRDLCQRLDKIIAA
jgi:L-ribulose-5-phosphate 3-epimerase